MTWNDSAFCARVVKRCEELGRSQRDVLKKAGLAHDYLQTEPKHSRRIDRIIQLAEELDMPLAKLLGLSARMDANIMLSAYRTAQELGLIQDQDQRSAKALGALYNLLVAHNVITAISSP